MFPGGKMPGEDFINSWYPILIALVLGMFIAFRNYMKGGQCPSQEKMKGKTVIVTGANCGIGLETARELAARGARVILACRNEDKAKEAIEDIKRTTKSDKLVSMTLDLSSFDSIKQFAEEFKKKEEHLHVLINNAGIMCHPQDKTKDGHEIHFGVNYLGAFLLSHLLLDKLKASAPSRIINVTALAYQIGVIDVEDLGYENREYKAGDAYAQSKLALVLFTQRLAKELEGTQVTCNVLHPGVVNTDIHRHMPFRQSTLVGMAFAPFTWLLMKRAKDGAQTVIHCAVAKEEEGVSGKYYADCQLKPVDDNAKNPDLEAKLWDLSLKLTGLEKEEEKKSDEPQDNEDEKVEQEE